MLIHRLKVLYGICKKQMVWGKSDTVFASSVWYFSVENLVVNCFFKRPPDYSKELSGKLQVLYGKTEEGEGKQKQKGYSPSQHF